MAARLRRRTEPRREPAGLGVRGGPMLNAIDKVLFLMRAAVTADATTDGLSRLAAVAHDLELERGARLFEPGADAESLWIVLDGAVRVDIEGMPPRLAEAGDW